MGAFRHGRLVIDLPQGWADQSTLAFIARPPSPTLLTTATVAPPAEAIQLNFFSRPKGGPREVLKSQAEELEREDASFTVVSQGPFTSGIGEGWHYVQRMDLDGYAMKQLVVAIDLKDAVLFGSAVASEQRFEQRVAEMRKILESIRVAEDAE